MSYFFEHLKRAITLIKEIDQEHILRIDLKSTR